MKADLGCIPAHIVAGIGPAIGPCCYEVGRDVVEAARAGFGGEAVLRRGDRSYFDIRRANVRQLLAEGVRRESIEVADICTSCAHDRFFSYRRDGAAGGRLCGVVGFVR
jgi:copper oxidase (laccase) domain-containing protein